ncbi:hypothetical protein SAMD00023353_0104450 [Rosellinia necatrix]|uniref:Uncharacterized protein n=1 Tax=Rosellinia necatrix TaxID=77044 RepID=A0A1S7UI81_ROSNE|nr:hypothetical protein SAMD00023353_0104450 [Rosellinia necatrix]
MDPPRRGKPSRGHARRSRPYRSRVPREERPRGRDTDNHQPTERQQQQQEQQEQQPQPQQPQRHQQQQPQRHQHQQQGHQHQQQQRQQKQEQKQQEQEQKRQQQQEQEDRNKNEYDIRVDPDFLERFNREAHDGRVPPDPSTIPAEFNCIHCKKSVKREENHDGTLMDSGRLVVRPPTRFNHGEYEYEWIGGGGPQRWSCCGRKEGDVPPFSPSVPPPTPPPHSPSFVFSLYTPAPAPATPTPAAADAAAEDPSAWRNRRFSRGDPSSDRLDCPPTYHEHVAGAAGWPGWSIYVDGNCDNGTGTGGAKAGVAGVAKDGYLNTSNGSA